MDCKRMWVWLGSEFLRMLHQFLGPIQWGLSYFGVCNGSKFFRSPPKFQDHAKAPDAMSFYLKTLSSLQRF